MQKQLHNIGGAAGAGKKPLKLEILPPDKNGKGRLLELARTLKDGTLVEIENAKELRNVQALGFIASALPFDHAIYALDRMLSITDKNNLGRITGEIRDLSKSATDPGIRRISAEHLGKLERAHIRRPE
jgi:hypothetical protein